MTSIIFPLFSSLQLTVLSITVILNTILAVLVLWNGYKSSTNHLFGTLSLVISIWLVVLYLALDPSFSWGFLWWARLSIFLATPMNLSLYLLADTIPHPQVQIKKRNFWILTFVTAVIMVLNLTPYAFKYVVNQSGGPEVVPGIGFAPFAIFSLYLTILTAYTLIKRLLSAPEEEKKTIRLVVVGIFLMLALLFATVLLPVIFFQNHSFVFLTPVYALIFLGTTAYAIVKHHLFNLKVIATEAFTVILWIIFLARLLSASSFAGALLDGTVLGASLVFGVLLIFSVRKEVKQREEMEKLTVQLKSANEQLLDLSRFKNQLLSLASHQIRSPLAAIKGFSSILMGGLYGPVNDKIKETLGKIKAAADDLISLVNTLLDLRKAEEGKMNYQFGKVSLTKLAQEVVSLMQPGAVNKKLKFDFVPAPTESFVNADGEKLKQVIQNLVDNAIKYTPEGWVKVEILEQDGQVMLKVSDSGLGMPKDLLPYLFEEFVRDERITKEIRGTGLGLYIARKIIEAHNGKISADSAGENQGSTFTISLPKAV